MCFSLRKTPLFWLKQNFIFEDFFFGLFLIDLEQNLGEIPFFLFDFGRNFNLKIFFFGSLNSILGKIQLFFFFFFFFFPNRIHFFWRNVSHFHHLFGGDFMDFFFFFFPDCEIFWEMSVDIAWSLSFHSCGNIIHILDCRHATIVIYVRKLHAFAQFPSRKMKSRCIPLLSSSF